MCVCVCDILYCVAYMLLAIASIADSLCYQLGSNKLNYQWFW